MSSLDKIVYTLGLIEVHGADNMSRLLGCIQELRKIQAESIIKDGGDTDE